MRQGKEKKKRIRAQQTSVQLLQVVALITTYSSRGIVMRVKTAPAWLRRVCGVGPYGSHLDGRVGEKAPSTVDTNCIYQDPQLQRVCSVFVSYKQRLHETQRARDQSERQGDPARIVDRVSPFVPSGLREERKSRR